MKLLKSISFFLVIATYSFCSFAQNQTDAGDKSIRLKILSYNLRFGELASLEELASFIKEQNPDVVALQEVDNKTFRERAPKQNGKDFATELGFLTGMIPAYGKTIPYKGGYYGIGILSKYPLARVERIYLPKTENGKEQRALLVADVEYREGKYFTFVSTHLDYTNTEERQVQVKKLNEILLNNQYPVIIAGDFNAGPQSEEIEQGMKAWRLASALKPTAPAHAPKTTIDYIFCYPKSNWAVIENYTYSITLSDHLPIGAMVELKP